jgi:hypothetical protein
LIHFRICLKNLFWGWWSGSSGKDLSSKYEAPSSNPSTAKKKKLENLLYEHIKNEGRLDLLKV